MSLHCVFQVSLVHLTAALMLCHLHIAVKIYILSFFVCSWKWRMKIQLMYFSSKQEVLSKAKSPTSSLIPSQQCGPILSPPDPSLLPLLPIFLSGQCQNQDGLTFLTVTHEYGCTVSSFFLSLFLYIKVHILSDFDHKTEN